MGVVRESTLGPHMINQKLAMGIWIQPPVFASNQLALRACLLLNSDGIGTGDMSRQSLRTLPREIP